MTEKMQSRRVFIRTMMGTCLSGPTILKGLAARGWMTDVSYPIRLRTPNPYMENGKPIVVIVKGNNFQTMLARGMEILGGFSKLGLSKSVIIKPNFVFDKKTYYPTTTDESSVLTTIRYLQMEGFKQILVADRRAKRIHGRAGGKFEWSGLNARAMSGGFSTDSLMDDGIAEAVKVTDENFSLMSSIGVIKKVYETDLIINMPTLKRHTMTNLSCCLKNMMGVLDVDTTEYMHLWGDANKQFREQKSNDEIVRRLCVTIAEAAMAVNSDLAIIDARKLLCKDHLSVRTGEVRTANQLIISGDQLAADIFAAKILKEINPDYELGYTSETFSHAEKIGLGITDQNKIVLKEVEI